LDILGLKSKDDIAWQKPCSLLDQSPMASWTEYLLFIRGRIRSKTSAPRETDLING